MTKIYYVANARMPIPKAHGIQLAKMCEAMVASGADLELVLPKRKNISQSVENFYGLDVKIPIKKLPVLDFYKFGRTGFYLGSLSFMISYFFYILFKKLKGEKFIVYTVDMDRFSFLFLPYLGAQFFAEIHDAKPAYPRFELFFKRARGVIAINNIIKRELCENFKLDASKIAVHPNGIDLKMFSLLVGAQEARNKLGIPRDAKIALYSGKFYDWKGLDILVKAAELLDGKVLIYMVGGIADKLKKITGLDTPKNLICAGEKPYAEMPLWLEAADVFLVLGTKRNEYSYKHTSPMKLMEYMASRRPIVVSRTPANSEIVKEDEALFYEPDNPKDLADKICYALENKNNFQAMVNKAYNKVSKLSWKKRAESVLEFIESKM